MKILHLSDLHIGKKLHGYYLFEDQKYIFNQIIQQIIKETPQTVIIAGDIYDRSDPSVEAVKLFDWFLDELTKIKIKNCNLNIIIIGGNHDSDERLSVGSNLMVKNNVYISKAFNETIKPIILNDEFGEINFYLFPFVKPYQVKYFYPNETITDYNTAVKVAIENTIVDTKKRNILVTHQFVTGATTCDSEELSVGGSDNVSVENYKDFDYVALGHIHSPQDIKNDYTKARYCGTPLKYSLSESRHKKTLTFLEINEKNSEINFEYINLIPLRDLRCITDSFENLLTSDDSQDYLYCIITDENPIIDASVRLKPKFPNLLKLDYQNTIGDFSSSIVAPEKTNNMKPIDVFADMYKQQFDMDLDDQQVEILNELINEIWD